MRKICTIAALAFLTAFLTAFLAALLPPSAAVAQTPAIDTDQPIRINADSLEVKQQQQQAVFSGNVEAVQGELVLRADEVRVAYAFGEEQATPGQVIRRIEAEGNVVITTPEETAKADRAVYDVVAGTMQLEGEVVLVRGKNVVEGARLDIDLAAGRAVMVADAKTGTRVRATFVPAGEESASR